MTYHPTQLYFGMKSDRSLEWERLNYLSHTLLMHYRKIKGQVYPTTSSILSLFLCRDVA
ncbi:MAG: hypothetical protein O4750_13145 [Trichodesmium sp. St18_bin3_1_1]|nr:hypothetical protein [Trichodesmium sp. St4_bin8_1]MDE5092668.1 hypothetical protein [Trichodesmium sp. St18_bin3_1_1]